MADIPTIGQRLRPCPFCGHDTPEFERTGTSRQSCIVICGMCGARHESSDEYERSGSSWNARALPPADSAEMKRLADQVRSALSMAREFIRMEARGSDANRQCAVIDDAIEAAALLRRMAGEK